MIRRARYFIRRHVLRWHTGYCNGRYVAWGGGRRLDVQIGSRRDLALERAEKKRAAVDRAWADLMKRTAETIERRESHEQPTT